MLLSHICTVVLLGGSKINNLTGIYLALQVPLRLHDQICSVPFPCLISEHALLIGPNSSLPTI